MNVEDLKKWRDERNRVFRELDIPSARALLIENGHDGLAPSDEVMLMSLHKGRYQCLEIDKILRLESAEWLRARGYSGGAGPLLPPGELPG